MIHVHDPLDIVLLYLQYSACTYYASSKLRLYRKGAHKSRTEVLDSSKNVREAEAKVLFPLLTLLP